MDLADALAAARSDQGLRTRRTLAGAGVPVSRLRAGLAAGTAVRVRPAVYAAAPLPPLPRFVVDDDGVSPAYVLHVRSALLSLGPTAAACGRTAAALRGWGMLVEPSRTIDVAVPHGRSRVRLPHVRAHQRRRLSTERHVVLEGTSALRLTTALQTVVDCALELPLVEAVVVADSALRAGAVTVEQVGEAARRLAGHRDAARVRRVVWLADPASESVLESVLRVRLVLGGIEGFASQVVVSDQPGTHLRVDFCFERLGLVVEADGARWHRDPGRDRDRDNALAALGWRVLRFTWGEVVHTPSAVVETVRLATAVRRPDFHLAARDAGWAA